VRGAKYETAAPYANQAFVKPTNANWEAPHCRITPSASSAILVSQHQIHLPNGFAGRAPAADYPLSNRFDEVDALVIFDNVLVPGKMYSFIGIPGRRIHSRHLASLLGVRLRATQSEARGHDDRRGAVQRAQTGLDKQQAVQEKLAELAVYREGINAHSPRRLRSRRKAPPDS